jgi:4-alpha-glucanotransferase
MNLLQTTSYKQTTTSQAFCILRDLFESAEHWTWGSMARPTPRLIERLSDPQGEHGAAASFTHYLQYVLHSQLMAATKYANGKRIVLKGEGNCVLKNIKVQSFPCDMLHTDKMGLHCVFVSSFVSSFLCVKLTATLNPEPCIWQWTFSNPLLGDLPIGVDKRSVETWLHPHLFRMDCSTGAPPDYFDPNGQNWGFPT